MVDSAHFAAVIVADAFSRRAKGTSLGAIGENLPEFDVPTFLSELRNRIKGPFRVALLGSGLRNGRTPSGIEVTTSVKIANTWRNDEITRRGSKLFVVVRGVVAEGRLQSLDGKDRGVLVPVRDKDLREAIRIRASGLLETDKRSAAWSYFTRNEDLATIDSLLHFASILADVANKSNPHDVVDTEFRNLWILGLLPHRKLLDTIGEAAVAKMAKNNLELLTRRECS